MDTILIVLFFLGMGVITLTIYKRNRRLQQKLWILEIESKLEKIQAERIQKKTLIKLLASYLNLVQARQDRDELKRELDEVHQNLTLVLGEEEATGIFDLAHVEIGPQGVDYQWHDEKERKS